ncbi:TetR/AcrR family transcriptional regulator [Nodosilinea sp. LEGE 07298]|uniref:TetR/AcrR family transcriptional regulator n=1 Tax=Nodosilinea sp. LEGE 07298 TaxID=2777970 RepID=UPI0018815A6A|nr:TetR/AcrR family transcriptional regulator [Nodosilinea sp. LEGE 07298]MBE9109440.1 TetR/AcrR family transcriptional regulator [Nodosilinea sp. LEGE 07298]
MLQTNFAEFPSVNASDQPRLFSPFIGDPTNKAGAILTGALEVFTTYGYTAASMDRIAAVAGVSKSTLYTYFHDKEGLFVALIQWLTQNTNQIIFNLHADFDLQTPPDQVLRHMATSVLTEFSNNQSLLTLMRLMIGESEQFPELAKTFIRTVQKPLLEKLALYFTSQPQLNLPDPVVSARIFAGSLVHYLIIQNVLHGSDILPLEQERMIDGLIQMMMAAKDVSDE